MKLGVIGGGVVGAATAAAFRGYVDEICIHDVLPGRTTHSLSAVLACDLIFVCLPTPQKKNSRECDLSFIEGFFQHVREETIYPGREELPVFCNFVLKSTVPVGTTVRLRDTYNLPNLIHSPEFLTARTAVEDAKHPTRLLIGGPCCDGRTALCRLYDRVWPDVLKFLMRSDESEAVKLFQNSFSAAKIALLNEFYGYADRCGLDWQTVLKALLAGGWINPAHTQVPGPDRRFGFGGTCLLGTAAVKARLKDISLEKLFEIYESGEKLPTILSTDSQCAYTEYKEVDHVTRRQYDGELITLHTSQGQLFCTPDHLMPIIRNGQLVVVRASSILETDKLMVDV